MQCVPVLVLLTAAFIKLSSPNHLPQDNSTETEDYYDWYEMGSSSEDLFPNGVWVDDVITPTRKRTESCPCQSWKTTPHPRVDAENTVHVNVCDVSIREIRELKVVLAEANGKHVWRHLVLPECEATFTNTTPGEYKIQIWALCPGHLMSIEGTIFECSSSQQRSELFVITGRQQDGLFLIITVAALVVTLVFILLVAGIVWWIRRNPRTLPSTSHSASSSNLLCEKKVRSSSDNSEIFRLSSDNSDIFRPSSVKSGIFRPSSQKSGKYRPSSDNSGVFLSCSRSSTRTVEAAGGGHRVGLSCKQPLMLDEQCSLQCSTYTIDDSGNDV
ncbi:uncharacterized protein LOC131938292 isoform X2 [Physella acuta]|uniref:uncharacterized protein LOC131938292 isoform X2 n=1 Tax=Physella acuta TaxID=109671 RepID=UPI0027DD22E5|nr:uncharacterized protein LOC131938292 isoform X2 [Physella acuta]